MQLAALGVHLLYDRSGHYLTDSGAGPLQAAATPGGASEWAVAGTARRGFRLTNASTGRRITGSLVPARGCATYPEARVDASGRSFTAPSPESDVLGTVEGHAHVTAFELFGGDWHC